MKRRQAVLVGAVLLSAPAVLAILLWDTVATAARHFWAELRWEVRDIAEQYRYSPAERYERAMQQIRSRFPAPRTVTVLEDADA